MNDNPDSAIKREREIFLAALKITSSEERKAFLDGACGNDAPLRRFVESLLQYHSEDSFLEEPAIGAEALPSPESVVCEGVGTVVGRYKLLEKIGEGGMGVVYMAEQEEPVRRKVALKVIKLGMDTKQVVARFEAERQALALMDHPNIARVWDGGVTDTGRPFFVMELVQGVPITEFCDRNQLSVEERVKLFIPVCQAIQSAHQKGIIHRDLKPTNILVTLNAGVPHPMVIDFGVAKATNQKLTEKTVFTNYATMIGTPAYMSPEQAEMSRLDVDTRTDIYALGVLLYELFTGTTPFPEKRLRSASYREMQRIIMEEEPERPSTRLRQKSFNASPSSLTHSHYPLATDLDWIVMKCLEKDRARRYETANGLAADLNRHLENEPVVARPPSNLYRLQKLVRRNKLIFAAGASAILALAIGLGISIRSSLNERRALRIQEQLRQQAQVEAEKSSQVAQFLRDMLKGVGPSVALGRDTKLLREILDQTARRLDTELKGQPGLQAEMLETLGETYEDAGDFTNALAMSRRSLALRENLYGKENLDVASTLYNMGRTYGSLERQPEAEACYRESLTIREKLLGPTNLAVADSLETLGSTLATEKKFPEGELLLRQAVATRKALLGDDHARVASALTWLGNTFHLEGKNSESEAMLREALAINVKQRTYDSPPVFYILSQLGWLFLDERKFPEAEAEFREALQMGRRVFEAGHPELRVPLSGLGHCLRAEHRAADAESCYRESLALSRKLFGDQHPSVIDLEQCLAWVLKDQGKDAEAEAFFSKSTKKLPGDRNSDSASFEQALGWALNEQGKSSEAEGHFREALDLTKKLPGERDPDLALINEGLGWSLITQEKTAEAEDCFRQSLALITQSLREQHPDYVASIYEGLGCALANQGKFTEGERFHHEAIRVVYGLLKQGDSEAIKVLLDTLRNLASAIQNEGRSPSSDSSYREVLDAVSHSGIDANNAENLVSCEINELQKAMKASRMAPCQLDALLPKSF